MTEEVRDWLVQLCKTKLQNAIQVGDVIKDYFGEPLVDVQIPDIDNFLSLAIPFRNMVRVTNIGEQQVECIEGAPISREKWNTIKDTSWHEVTDETLLPNVRASVSSTLSTWLAGKKVLILIRFPRVTVTNENDQSIDITELYARVGVSVSGTLSSYLKFFRAEYTVSQWISNYAHSHLPGAYLEWQQPCLGSGPIRSTQNYLEYNFDLDRWGLFCYELSKYVTVESLDGVPYVRLESVGILGNRPIDFPYITTNNLSNYSPVLQTFSSYFLRTQTIDIAYVDGEYVLGCNPVDFLVDVTKCFLEWYNARLTWRHGPRCDSLARLKDRGVLMEMVIINKQLCNPRRGTTPGELRSRQGERLFTFKGETVTLNFTDLDSEVISNSILLLNYDYVCSLLTRILKVINYNYGQAKDKTASLKDSPYQKHKII